MKNLITINFDFSLLFIVHVNVHNCYIGFFKAYRISCVCVKENFK